MSIKNLPAKLPTKLSAVPPAVPVAVAEVLSAISDCVRTHDQERTRRETIEADKQVVLTRIERGHDLLDSYVRARMRERASLQANVFRAVDLALAKDSDEALERVLQVLETELSRNPLSEFLRMYVPENEVT